jgi:hypothetical protein
MNDETLRRRYEALRAAAMAVLDAATDSDPPLVLKYAPYPVRYTPTLHALYQALGEDEPAGPEPGQLVRDPARHLLTMADYRTSSEGTPVTLEQRAADLQARLDADRPIDQTLPGDSSYNVIMSYLRASVIASLLTELAARLLPGTAFGPGRDGQKLALICLDLANEFRNKSSPGANENWEETQSHILTQLRSPWEGDDF